MSNSVNRYLKGHMTDDILKELRDQKVKDMHRQLRHIENMRAIVSLLYVIQKLLGKNVKLNP